MWTVLPLLFVLVQSLNVASWLNRPYLTILRTSSLPQLSMATRTPQKLAYFCENYKILLGSGSFTRKLILNKAGFKFTVVKPDIDEKALGDRSAASKAAELVTLVANAKADAVMQNLINTDEFAGHILLTGDQVVTFNGTILEKPKDEIEARTFIEAYSNMACTTVGIIILTDVDSKRRVQGVDRSTIHFGQLPSSVVDTLLSEGDVLSCAGGLMVEHHLIQPYITSIEGTEDSLMGLSTELLQTLFNQLENDIAAS
jgi:septum formation protein